MDRRMTSLLALALAACGGPLGGWDLRIPEDLLPAAERLPVDAASLADQSAGPADMSMPDLVALPDFALPSRTDAGPCGRFLDHGYCFDETPPCTTDADCAPPYFACVRSLGRCRAWNGCGCVSDLDCPPSDFCLTNEAVCGACEPKQPSCNTDSDCKTGDVCRAGSCAQVCCP
jgi:hypothetical protein